ncbi:MAG: c-type cytochrome [Candidatus Marinarcus sp.]|uniref:c-type cytochrome n=1 Tax=Candidatus Marinarcus sp. TaxID=3100987 RepID=UPI003B004DAD
MKKVLIFISLLTTLCFANPFSKCLACHGSKGETSAMGTSKIIKNLTKEQIMAALKGYQDGTYGGALKSIMHTQASGLTDADIKEIASSIGK